MSIIHSATFAAVAVSAAQDAFEIAAASPQKVAIRGIILAQYSDFGDAAAEILSVQLIIGHLTTGSGGATVTTQRLKRVGTGPDLAATSTVKRNNTTIASTGTGLILHADAANIATGWVYRPPADERIIIDGTVAAQARLVCRISAPADELTVNGTLIFEENPAL